MLAVYPVLFLIALCTIWLGLKIAEEVYRIAVIIAGAILLVMAFVSAPSFVQVGSVLLLLGIYQLYVWQPKFNLFVRNEVEAVKTVECIGPGCK
ncbi:hypothetical protein Riv7116_4289 [Rivularia sp. PCC 7116]|uniref:hypothetical protein n=1 Tax=Rivularia sp. PCC 7116 TaxID=373994 RepID=UPI00029F4402|nr:hypothetical protein [Rivularia sp. PCC 7116]AFY56718.1 hypothetical protein Riv7116_4289 [Rivularia sp. PCC 7116]